MHIPDDPGYYEKFYFTPGDLDFSAHRTEPRDARHADLLGSMVSRSGAADRVGVARRYFFIRPRSDGAPTWEPAMRNGCKSAWETVQRGHAIANGMFVVVVNRVGTEGAIEFWGNSFVGRSVRRGDRARRLRTRRR